VIDDLANRRHDCDLLIDQNLGREEHHYMGLLPPHARVLAGTRYAMLRPEFATARPHALERRRANWAEGLPVRRVLVSMGLTDVGGVTARIMPAVLKVTSGCLIDIVIGSSAPGLPWLRDLASAHAGIALHVDSTGMSSLMAAADLAIGAAGSTSWERCCLGLPTVMVVLAENQRQAAIELAAMGASAAIAGPDCDADLQTAVKRLIASDDARFAMSQQSALVCDGEGVGRVAAAVLQLLA
jgi:UDP-2,4-diacetamido-2,4,6-trideoxy-beta-L-altropyranose hydrolase